MVFSLERSTLLTRLYYSVSLLLFSRFEGVPLIFTEYYQQDCELNLEKVDSLVEPELTMMVEPVANPFCSSLPAREA